MKKEPIKRYSQAFKQQVVREYEAGASATSLAQRYGIGTHTTIKLPPSLQQCCQRAHSPLCPYPVMIMLALFVPSSSWCRTG